MISILKSGYFQDGLKALVYLIPLVYVIARRRNLNLKYFYLLTGGLVLLFFGHFMDFIDELEVLRRLPIDERFYWIQDFLEDMVGFTLGFILFMSALYLELRDSKGRGEL
ncbi:MAG: hypothetical protein ABID09_07815 [Candidatus Omnitrophota bacterium]